MLVKMYKAGILAESEIMDCYDKLVNRKHKKPKPNFSRRFHIANSNKR